MSDWKVSGVVKDSEDEDDTLDSQETGFAPSPPKETKKRFPRTVPNANPQSVWDVPSSPITDKDIEGASIQRQTLQERNYISNLLDSSPLSSAPEDDNDELFDSQYDAQKKSRGPATTRLSSNIERRDSPDPLDFRDDNTPRGQVSLGYTQSKTQPDNEPERQVSAEARMPPIPLRQQSASSMEHGDAQAAAMAAAWRFERSLRPRKPIQEHPYLLESAQYSSVLRSHGMRPVRLHQDERVRLAVEEDSQEQAFQDESQKTASDCEGKSWEDSQTAPGPDDRHSMPNFSSSFDRRSVSPRDTSPPQTRGTNPTSPVDASDEELPSVEAIFRKASRGSTARKRQLSPSDRNALEQQAREAGEEHTDSRISGEQQAKRPRLVIPPPLLGTDISTLRPVHGSTLTVEIPERFDAPTAASYTEVDTGITSASSVTDSGNDSESSLTVTTYRRQARGVLPASHFRLDQVAARKQERQNQAARRAEAHIDRRRGVAVRTMSPHINRTAQLPPRNFHDSDSNSDSDSDLSEARPRHAPLFQRLLDTEGGPDGVGSLSASQDAAADLLLTCQSKEYEKSSTSLEKAKRRRYTQSKIVGHFTQSHPMPALADRRPKASRTNHLKPARPRKRRKTGPSKRTVETVRPPQLGILDVIEPRAPTFLKVAARTARARVGKGRSSPGGKSIQLATREDQLDAGRILADWKTGRIRQRSVPRATATACHPFSAHVSPNTQERHSTTEPPAIIRSSDILTTDAQSNKVGPNAQLGTDQPLPQRSQVMSLRRRRRPDKGDARPAQFEEDLTVRPGRLAFHRQKRLLDTIYRRTAKSSTSPSTVSGGHTLPNDALHPHPATPEPFGPQQSPLPLNELTRRRLRKKAEPCHVEISSATYVFAHDPLPDLMDPPPSPMARASNAPKDILHGLGPFGTHYSQHFEIFPLPAGVFFHGDTLLGQGCLSASLDSSQMKNVWLSRPRVSMTTNGRSLCWGTWSDEVSSEFGTLMDAIGHHLTSRSSVTEAHNSFDVRMAADFAREYVQEAFGTSEPTHLRGFVARVQDAIGSLLSHLEDQEASNNDKPLLHQILEVLTRLIIIAAHSITLCQQHDILQPQMIGAESLLHRLSKACVSTLLNLGLEAVSQVYRDAQRLSSRERGIRTEHIQAQAWIVLMVVLDHLKIPRMGFWDVVYSILITPEDRSSNDARRFEELWQTMFVLLPLCDFNELGMIPSGARQRLAPDGWALPQLALKRVFEMYKSNKRQPPGFNDYCRALFNRCHFLVDQWSWLRCGTLIGSSFDFFASMSLSHLRNEEVGQSPAFLNELHLNPSLQIMPKDRCFHVFLKLVALNIKRLSDLGCTKDIRNLVFRILPNHNRQYLKEQDVFEHDLAALRNHHDLLCTLFWAAPPGLRPQLSQMEKLVNAATSHKEACMINLRAWSQIARFVASKETAEVFSPLFKWQAQIFQQLLDQYNAIDTEIQQQFQDMARGSAPDISQDITTSIIAGNKAATMEVLNFSIMLSQDVARHAHTVELAVLAGNYFQIQQVFQHFSTPTPEYPWTILQRSLVIMDSLLDRIEHEYSRQINEEKIELEGIVMLLDHNLTTSFFCMARRMARTETKANTPSRLATVMAESVEQVVRVAGKMAALLVRSGTMRLSQCFKPGRQCLFEKEPTSLTLHQRRLLPLFLAEFQSRVSIDLVDIGFSQLQLWLQSLVKPQPWLCFERQFASALLRSSAPFLPPSAAVGKAPVDYEANRCLFEYSLLWMRESFRGVDKSEKRDLIADFSDALRKTMKQIEKDLKISVEDEMHHPAYVSFVRRVISLIKSHGAGICTITPYFYQVSREFSPPQQDPRLQAAQIQSYGIRLTEGDPTIAPQLFSFLHHSFKQALLQGHVAKEVTMLQRGLRSNATMIFMLSKMLPAIMWASLSKPESFIMFDAFCEAICLRLSKPSAPRDLGSNGLDASIKLLQAALDWMAVTWSRDESQLRRDQVHMFRKIVFLLNQLQPHFESQSLISEIEMSWHRAEDTLGRFSKAMKTAEQYLRAEYVPGSGRIEPGGIFAGCESPRGTCQDAQVASLASELVMDISRTWVVSEGFISIQTPNHGASQRQTQYCRGLKLPQWDAEEVVMSLHEQLFIWNSWWSRCWGRTVDQASYRDILDV